MTSTCSLYSALFCSITDANKYTQEELRFMKSQDASYMALRAQTEMKVQQLVALLAFVNCVAAKFVFLQLLGQSRLLMMCRKLSG